MLENHCNISICKTKRMLIYKTENPAFEQIENQNTEDSKISFLLYFSSTKFYTIFIKLFLKFRSENTSASEALYQNGMLLPHVIIQSGLCRLLHRTQWTVKYS